MLQFWALLVSIEHYANSDWPVVAGAHKDAADTCAYLTNDRQVPHDHVVSLKDSEASRQGILAAFKDHLIDNPMINKGDAILFHFSGHGSIARAPDGWTVIEEKTGDEQHDNLVEVIVPWDDGVPDKNTDIPTCSIPDRTLAALIAKVAAAHGNNITIVLDCCCSGHGTRGGSSSLSDDEEDWVARMVDPSQLAPLVPELDNEIVASVPSEIKKTKRGRLSSLSADHVLMAACGPREQAMGGGKRGGLFTAHWLHALRRTDIVPQTYSEIQKAIDADIGVLRTKHHLNQHPQCDGIVRDRVVFEETMMRKDYFDAERRRDLGDQVIEVQAGEAHGVQVGTLFELHVMDKNLQSQRTLGTAVVDQVHATRSFATFGNGIIIAGLKCTALVLQHPGQLKYSIVSDHGQSEQANASVKRFHESIAKAQPHEKANLMEVAVGEEDLRLDFDIDGGITLHRHDGLLGSLKNKPPYINPEEVAAAEFCQILNGIARFNRLLALSSVTRPFADQVDFELHHLSRRADDESDQDEDGFVLREADKPMEIVHDEVTVVQDSADELGEDYAIVLHNHTSSSLFAQVWYFDPRTYSITPCYKSADATKPNLYPKAKLQIGASTERADPLQFYVPDGASSDTIFAKVLLTDKPTKLDFLMQDELIGEDADGVSVILRDVSRRVGEGQAETRGQWDTILRKITAVEPTEEV